jgi:DTW domain-containing protein YfiP
MNNRVMNLNQYIQQKQSRLLSQPMFKERCQQCLQPVSWCFCSRIEPFDCGMKFAVLLHPLERRRRIASGRMAHLILKNSQLITGHNYTHDFNVNQLLANPDYFPVVLCLGQNSKNLSLITEDEKESICPVGKKLLIFVVDGTWGTASKTVRLSENLKNLPRISFTPSHPSRFRVRQQPKKNCYSTIEAIHETIDLLGCSQGFNVKDRAHDHLLEVFDSFVTQQVNCIQDVKARLGGLQYRKRM